MYIKYLFVLWFAAVSKEIDFGNLKQEKACNNFFTIFRPQRIEERYRAGHILTVLPV
jgi:hypothetical protein